MKNTNNKKEKRERRHKRIRAKVRGTSLVPRLSVFKSNKHISAQIVDDSSGKTLASSHSRKFSGKKMIEKSALVGEDIAKKANEGKINKVVFDRGGFIYTGNVKALAEGARKAGLKF
jgi:large subunit ribosomal protein L18